MKHVLIVDDDSSIRNLLTDYLTKFAIKVTAVPDGQSMLRVMSTESVDLVIVDLNLGFEDGLEIVRSLSSKSDAPIIIISGDRLEEADKVVGLELGASDYITKPFAMRELLARVRSALRERPQKLISREPKLYRFKDWVLNVKQRKLVDPAGTDVKLTSGEFNLLIAFLKAPKSVLSREQLLSASRVHDEEIFDRSIDVLILRLRRKLSSNLPHSQLIKTERGAGYLFDAEVAVEQFPSIAGAGAKSL